MARTISKERNRVLSLDFCRETDRIISVLEKNKQRARHKPQHPRQTLSGIIRKTKVRTTPNELQKNATHKQHKQGKHTRHKTKAHKPRTS